MKKFITFIVAAFCLASSMSAQGSYYYYHGAKMPLSEDATKKDCVNCSKNREYNTFPI